jgi:parallel beta-helix repeat protein
MPQVFTVGSKAELLQALSQASGGDTISLNGGNYGDVFLQDTASTDLTFSSAVTIRSADPGNPAVFTGMDVRGATNLTFDGVVFDYVFESGDPIFLSPFVFSNTTDLTIRNSTFDGDLAQDVSAMDDGFGYGVGLSVRASSGVTLDGNTFFDFHRGLGVSESSDITVSNNDIHSMRSDGMNFVEVTDIVIEENYLHDFRASLDSSDHRDMIQFWTTGADTPSTNITIRGNILDIGEGDFTQSIFMRNERVDQGLAGSELFYRNVLIENNVITNAHSHGITVGETMGLIIRNNSVLHADGGARDGLDSSVEIPRISVAAASTGVIITNNLTGGIAGWSDQAGWQVTDNGIVQDQNPLAAGYYGNVFLASSLQPVNGTHSFILLPGSAFALAGTGAAASQPEAAEGLILAQFHVFQIAGDGAARVFDARFNLDIAAEVTHEWDFGDGTIITGAVVEHSFASGGMHDVTLTLRHPDGSIIAVSRLDVPVSGPDVLALEASGQFVTYDHGVATPLTGAATGTAAGIQLGAPGVTATITRNHVADIARTDEVDISLTLRADTAGAAGEVARQHGSFVISVTAAGELALTLSSASGAPGITLTTAGAGLADLASHEINIALADGRAIITVDGVVKGNTAFAGPLGWTGSHDLTFGNPWGGANFNGDLLGFGIKVDASDYPATPQTQVLVGVETRILSGGVGNDVYVLNSSNVIIRDLGGSDEIRSASLSVDLGTVAFADIEHATLTGGSAENLTGNDAANQLTGNDAANILAGGAGQDTLQGGGGTDTLQGGSGNDTYIVDHRRDTIIERAGQGSDTVQTSVSYVLTGGVENGILTGTATSLTGNTLANHLTGNRFDNILDGRAGADRLTGGGGADTFVFSSRSGRDTITDFDTTGANHDVVDLRGLLNVQNASDLWDNHIRQSGADVLIIGNSADVLRLEDVALADLDAQHFLI